MDPSPNVPNYRIIGNVSINYRVRKSHTSLAKCQLFHSRLGKGHRRLGGFAGGDPSDAIFDASPNPRKGCYTMHSLGNIGHRGTHGTQVKNEDRRPMGECNRRVTKKRCGRKWVGRGWSRKTITQLKQWRIWETQSEVKMFRIVGPSSKSKSVIPWSHRWHGSGGDASPCLDIITLQLYKWQAH